MSNTTTSSARAHLDVHMARLRLRLQRYMRRYADRLIQVDGSYSDLCVGPQEFRRLIGGNPKPAAHAWLDQHGVPDEVALKAKLESAREDIDDLLKEHQEDAALPIEDLRGGFALSELELDLLLTAAAPALAVDMARLMSVAWADFSLRQPTAGFLAEVLADTPEEVDDVLALLQDGSPLLRFRLLVAGTSEHWRPTTPRVHAPISVPQRILDFLVHKRPPGAGVDGCTLDRDALAREDLILHPDIEAQMIRGLRKPRARMVLLGPTSSGRRTALSSLVHNAGQALLIAPVAELLTGGAPAEEAVADAIREARLQGAALLLRADELPQELEVVWKPRAARLARLLEGAPGPVLMSATSHHSLVRALLPSAELVRFVQPPRQGQLALWRRALRGAQGTEAEASAQLLADAYQIYPGAANRALEQVRARHGARGVTASLLLEMVRRQFDHRLSWLADVVTTNLGMSDMVLPEEVMESLREVLIHARHAYTVFHRWGFAESAQSGVGLSVMFSGPPGTGKTMMAAVLARELGRVLYRVDLSRIVDKYIGETEKNLGRVFDEAERAQAVLLFDEADSLFAKRTQVKSSNDRYANLEVNFLLQRLESYQGVSILTTNFSASIDEAFQRRLRFQIEFPMPEPELRARLWQRLVPPGAPLAEGINWEKLGKAFVFSGGHVRNAVLRAAMQAAASDQPIDEATLYAAGVAENRALGGLVRVNPS